MPARGSRAVDQRSDQAPLRIVDAQIYVPRRRNREFEGRTRPNGIGTNLRERRNGGNGSDRSNRIAWGDARPVPRRHVRPRLDDVRSVTLRGRSPKKSFRIAVEGAIARGGRLPRAFVNAALDAIDRRDGHGVRRRIVRIRIHVWNQFDAGGTLPKWPRVRVRIGRRWLESSERIHVEGIDDPILIEIAPTDLVPCRLAYMARVILIHDAPDERIWTVHAVQITGSLRNPVVFVGGHKDVAGLVHRNHGPVVRRVIGPRRIARHIDPGSAVVCPSAPSAREQALVYAHVTVDDE